MSRLRPECGKARSDAVTPTYGAALRMVYEAVKARRSLIYGRLHNSRGGHCAMGACWTDNPDVIMPAGLVDEVAAVNDSVPPTATSRERWRTVRRWLRMRVQQVAYGR